MPEIHGRQHTPRRMGKASRPRTSDRLRVLIAGGGVAGLEAMLALRDLAGDLVDVELLSPEYDFWYRPLAVGEPFDVARVERFALPSLVSAAGATFTPGAVSIVEPDARLVQTSHGSELAYDVLLVAAGTRPLPVLGGALTFRGPSDVDRLRALVAEIDTGAAKRIAFVLPRRAGWPLPLYELALLAAAHVEDRGVRGVELSLVTTEAAPLAALGPEASGAVASRLHEHRVAFYPGHYPIRFEEGRLELVPDETLAADQVVALARLEGQQIPGLPHDREGFLAVDRTGRVDGLDDVYAAGDITSFPIKQGGIAAQQSVAVAETIAARAGADVVPRPFTPILNAVLLTGREPLYLHAELAPDSGAATTVTTEPLHWPPAKIASQYLAPFLATLERGAAFTR